MTGRAPSPLSDEERGRIAAAIAAAEAGTSGEIVVLVAARTGLYRSHALVLALLVGLAAPWPLILLTGLSAATIAWIQAASVLLVLAASLPIGMRLLLTPRPLREARGREAAQREFLTRGLIRTRGRTGVLIYVALAEHHAEIVADLGIREGIADAPWESIVGELVASAGSRRLADGLVDTVARVGTILAERFPPLGANPDELPNHVIVIE